MRERRDLVHGWLRKADSDLAALELALSLPERPPTTAAARRRSPAGPDLVDLQERASEAAFAVGRMSQACQPQTPPQSFTAWFVKPKAKFSWLATPYTTGKSCLRPWRSA